MDKFFEFLPTLIFIFIFGRRFFKRMKDGIEEVTEKGLKDISEAYPEEIEIKDEFDDKREDEKIEEFKEDNQFEVEDKSKEYQIKEEKSENKSKMKRVRRTKVKREAGQIKLKEDLVKGVIFKEILDKPRAKRPYRPRNR